MRRLWVIASLLAVGGSACEVIAGLRTLEFVPDAAVAHDDAQGTSVPPATGSHDTDALEAPILADDSPSMESDTDAVAPDSNATQFDASSEDVNSDSDPRDASPEGSRCLGDLSNIGVRDFSISFSLTTSQRGTAALVNQRTACSFGMFWDIRLTNGSLQIETSDGTNYAIFKTTGRPVNDGASHDIIVRRTAELVSVHIDGAAAGTGASGASFAQLPPVSGMDPCEVGPMKDGTVALSGTLTNLCIAVP